MSQAAEWQSTVSHTVTAAVTAIRSVQLSAHNVTFNDSH